MKLTITLEDTGNSVAYSISRSTPYAKGEFTQAEMFAAMLVLEAEERGFMQKEGVGNVVQLIAVS